MKKILLQKERDEVSAASSGNLPPPVSHSEIPFSSLQNSCLEENKCIVTPSDECIRIETPSKEQSRTGTPSIERSRAGRPLQIGSPYVERVRIETPSRSDILKVSSLISGTSVPVPAVPVLMMSPNAGEVGLGHDKYYLGSPGSAVFSLPPYSLSQYYQIGDSQLQNVSPTRLLRPVRMKDERYLEESVSRATTSFNIPVDSHCEESILPLRAKAELHGYTEQYSFDKRSLSLARACESLLEEKRADADLDSVSSSDTVEKQKNDSMKVVEVDSDDEDTNMRKWRSNALDDIRNDDLPRMIDKERHCMWGSPLIVSDRYNQSRKENVRADSVDTFKSPAVEHQKTISRPKGRPAKMAFGGDVGPGGRSIIRCQICGKLFNNSSALAKHKLTHSDERKYACNLCSKAFKRQDHLNGHMMTHSSTKPFGCKFIGCNKSYCDARSLRRHMENHHQECSAAAGSSSSFFNFDTSIPHPFGSDISAEKSGSYLQQVSPISPVLRDGPPPLSRPFADFSSSHPQCATVWVTGYNPLDEPKPVKCGVCGRGFKNIPALNGHMRLHGGYVRKDQDMDESQDISRGSETHSESRFSLQSESSQSSTSVSDHQHDSIMSSGASISSSGFCAKPNVNGSEPDRRQFLIRPSSTEEEHLHNRRLLGPLSEPKISVSQEDSRYFPEAKITCSSAAEPKNRNESGIYNSFEMNHLVQMQHGTFENSNLEARPQCPSPQTATKHNEGAKRIVEVKMRCAEDEKSYVQMAGTTSVDDVKNILAECSTSTMKEPQNKMKCEIQQEKSSNSSCSDLQQPCKPCKKQRTSVGANDISDAVILTESNAATDRHLVELTGTGCQIGIRPSNQVKSSISCGKKIDGYLTSLPNVAKTGEEEKIQTSGNDSLPDSTSEKEEIDVCRLDKPETCVDGQPKLGNPYKSGMSQTEIVQKVDNNSSAFVACKMHDPSENQEFVHGVPSSQIEQGGCLYRKRWMSLQLKQAGIHYNEHSETTSTSSTRDQCSDSQVIDGTNTDCGEPSSPKCSSKFGGNVHFQPSMYRSYVNENAEANDSVNSHCLPGSHETSFVATRSGQTTPVQHADQSSSLLSKRGSSGMFTYPYIALQREMTAPVVHGCHSASVAGRECLLRHVHSNSCITQVDDVQSIIPSSPYDLHPHTPCAAHTPYTPCQTYTPHTPYTPVNQPGTPKHASHFEFPPRDYLHESSFCDSSFAAHGSQMKRSIPQLEVCLVVEPENSRYLTQQSLKTADAEIESGSLHQLCQDESLYRKVAETEDLDKEHLVWHNVLDGSNHSHALTRRKQRLFSGSQGQMRDACHSLVQNEARNPDDGMSASPPIGARYDSHLLPNADEGNHFNDKKHDKQMERKRKNSSEIESESDCKRPVVVRSITSGDKILGDADVKAKQEDIKAVEVDGDLQKSCADRKSGIIFRNPPSPLKVKKPKPRPEPLFIPAHVNHIGFQSRLRSPRLWDGLTKQNPPYTPPPMLSPARSGPGLFWTLHSGCHSPIGVPPVLSKYGRPKGGKSLTEDNQSVIEFETEPPATDTHPHINIGSQYQPDLPLFQGCKRDFSDCDNHSSLVWNPSIVDELGDDEMAQYMDYACCAAIPGNGVNKEYALHLLHMCKGDMKKAGKLLLEPEPKLPKSCGFMTYKYQECTNWKKTEIELFHRAIMKVDKDFFQIAKLVSTKTVKDCVQFYYLWKKICPDESKQLKLLRRKREQLELYSRRSKDLHDQPPPPIKSCVQQTQKSCDKMTADSEPKKSVKDDSTELCYQASFGICNTLKEEKLEDAEKHWCSFCKRSFTSARNFSVHMKKHRQSAPGMDPAEFSQAVKLPYPALSSVF